MPLVFRIFGVSVTLLGGDLYTLKFYEGKPLGSSSLSCLQRGVAHAFLFRPLHKRFSFFREINEPSLSSIRCSSFG